jgi:hypothetical protein
MPPRPGWLPPPPGIPALSASRATRPAWDDPLARYAAATSAQAHHQAVAAALAAERGRIAAALNSPGPDGTRLTYEQIAGHFGTSRSNAQKLVERGRRLAR